MSLCMHLKIIFISGSYAKAIFSVKNIVFIPCLKWALLTVQIYANDHWSLKSKLYISASVIKSSNNWLERPRAMSTTGCYHAMPLVQSRKRFVLLSKGLHPTSWTAGHQCSMSALSGVNNFSLAVWWQQDVVWKKHILFSAVKLARTCTHLWGCEEKQCVWLLSFSGQHDLVFLHNSGHKGEWCESTS